MTEKPVHSEQIRDQALKTIRAGERAVGAIVALSRLHPELSTELLVVQEKVAAVSLAACELGALAAPAYCFRDEWKV